MKFSTVLRMSKQLILSDDIGKNDATGMEPTPQSVKNLDITFARGDDDSEITLPPHSPNKG